MKLYCRHVVITVFALSLIVSSGWTRTVTVNLAAEFGCCEGIRGDINNDGNQSPDISDLVVLIDYIWNNGPIPDCDDEADVNGDQSKEPDVVDIVYLIDYLWFGHAEPPACPAHADCYPNSEIGTDLQFYTHVNSIEDGNPATGVPINWQAACPGDWQREANLEYSWRFFGPYNDDKLQLIRDQFADLVYETIWGHVLEIGDILVTCDSVLGPDGYIVNCEELLITTGSDTTATGHLTQRLKLDDPEFINSPLNRLVEQSSDGSDIWVSDTSHVLYNVFRNAPSDTTVQSNFLFELTVRDVNEGVELVPSFEFARVVDPKFERDILVINYLGVGGWGRINTPTMETIEAFWDTTITNWYDSPTNPSICAPFDVEKDFLFWGNTSSDLPLVELLKHRVLVLYSDGIVSADFLRKPSLFTALDVGVNAWLTMRSPLIGGVGSTSRSQEIDLTIPTFQNGQLYAKYFGLDKTVYSGWVCSATESIFQQSCPEGRIEDFVGANSLDPVGWPDLTIDTARLHSLYRWDDDPRFNGGFGWYPFNDSTVDPLGALPEVNWSLRGANTEPLYTYKSLYGDSHPFGEDYNFEGKSVAHRLETTWFRTVHMNFTPLAINPTQMQIVVDSVLNWLYDPTLTVPAKDTRYLKQE